MKLPTNASPASRRSNEFVVGLDPAVAVDDSFDHPEPPMATSVTPIMNAVRENARPG